jgi:hypothetical protein
MPQLRTHTALAPSFIVLTFLASTLLSPIARAAAPTQCAQFSNPAQLQKDLRTIGSCLRNANADQCLTSANTGINWPQVCSELVCSSSPALNDLKGEMFTSSGKWPVSQPSASSLPGSCSAASAKPANDLALQRIEDATLPTLNYRILIGVDVAGASSTDPTANLLAAGSINTPIGVSGIFSRAWLWGDARITSVAQASSLSSASSVSSYVSPALSNPSQMVQAAEVQGGLAFDPGRPLGLGTGAPWKIQGLISGGFLTPLSPSQEQPAYYVATNQVQNYYSSYASQFASACKNSSGTVQTCYVAFVPADQSSFFHFYQAGLRYEKWWTSQTPATTFLFPAIVDLEMGQNDYVTGGGLKGVILHLAGTTTIPTYPYVYLGGGFDLRVIDTPKTGSPLLLIPPASGTTLTLTTSSVVPIAIPQPNRDRYEMYIGLDLTKVVSLWKTAQTAQKASTP